MLMHKMRDARGKTMTGLEVIGKYTIYKDTMSAASFEVKLLFYSSYTTNKSYFFRYTTYNLFDYSSIYYCRTFTKKQVTLFIDITK